MMPQKLNRAELVGCDEEQFHRKVAQAIRTGVRRGGITGRRRRRLARRRLLGQKPIRPEARYRGEPGAFCGIDPGNAGDCIIGHGSVSVIGEISTEG
jgi:hypothetical protein